MSQLILYAVVAEAFVTADARGLPTIQKLEIKKSRWVVGSFSDLRGDRGTIQGVAVRCERGGQKEGPHSC